MVKQLPASYKDRSGFVFLHNGQLFRQVNLCYQKDYRHLMQSGLYDVLIQNNLLVSHNELEHNFTGDPNWLLTLQPNYISLISYPYEWSFSQLKDAALLTLNIMETAMQKGMILKDATPYNIQFVEGKPLFIDTLSFAIYREDEPWVAYYQFCISFLYPLMLAKYGVQDIHKTYTAYPDGISAKETIALLPKKSRFHLFNYLHLYLAANFNKDKPGNGKKVQFSKTKMQNLVTHLKTQIQGYSKSKIKTNWNTYYKETILSDTYLQAKEKILAGWATELEQQTILDLGSNDGYFSLLFAKHHGKLISVDADADCIDNFYCYIRENLHKNIQPLCLDILQPSTDQGFFNKERIGFFNRINVDTVLMLAVVHHLVISKNLTFELIAKNLATITNYLIIEFVPKSDPKVQQLFTNKEDIFTDYSEDQFEKVFSEYFFLDKKQLVLPTERVLYFFKKL